MYRDYESWAIWYEEFFKPAQPLLEAAPWIMVPGNHEACSWPDNPGSDGWFLLLDHETALRPRACFGSDAAFLPPSALDLNKDLRLILLDSATPTSTRKTSMSGKLSSDQANRLRVAQMAQTRFHQHQRLGFTPNCRPWAGLCFFTSSPHKGMCDSSQASLLFSAKERTSPKNIHSVLSGDLHFLQHLTTNEGAELPTQLIVGTGGIKLDRIPHEEESPPPGDGLAFDSTCEAQDSLATDIEGQAPAGASSGSRCEGRTWKAHGYLLATKTSNGWSLEFRSPTEAALRASVKWT
jgi:hypothetical protein